MNITDVRIENLRSLKDTGFIKLKPLMVLVGNNSSGKSTFLRFFPLMTQSLRRPIRGVIAWTDESLVNFGDYKTAFNRNALDGDLLRFSFRIESNKISRTYPHSFVSYGLHLSGQRLFKSLFEIFDRHNIEASFVLINSKDGRVTNLKEMTLKVDKKSNDDDTYENIEDYDVITISFEDRDGISISINNRKIDFIKFKKRTTSDESFVPSILPYPISDTKEQSTLYAVILELLNPLLKYCPKQFKHVEKLESLFSDWSIDRKIYKKIIKENTGLPNKLRNIILSEEEVFEQLFENIYVVMFCLFGIKYLNECLKTFFLNCDYTSPLRVKATRYYLYENQQVFRVDANGKNLPDFISSMTDNQKKDYDKFMQKVLGITVHISNLWGHQTINIRNKAGIESNLADVGFGYSQILPILTKIWVATRHNKFNISDFSKSNQTTLLIEQPELHLHPALQAKLADALLRVIQEEKYPVNIIIETHSPTILNRIGKRIAEERIDSNAVEVLIFNKDSETKNTEISKAKFNTSGRLINWPYGFFDPDDDPDDEEDENTNDSDINNKPENL